MATVELGLAHDGALQGLQRVEGGQFWRLLLPHVPNIQIALDGGLLLLPLPLAVVLLPLADLRQTVVLLLGRPVHPLVLVEVGSQLAELASQQRQRTVQLVARLPSCTLLRHLSWLNVGLLPLNFLLESSEKLGVLGLEILCGE
jgi:hypothetical protein